MEWIDETRRHIGKIFDTIGLGPQEAPYHVIANFPGARVRKYLHQTNPSGPVILVVPAPFKQPYIWDLMPTLSVIRQCLARQFQVYLLEWTVPTKHEDGFGLAEYAQYLPLAAVKVIETETGSSTPILVGHSLGGTFAAIFATLFPERVGGLVLADAPLAFGEHGGPFTRAMAAIPHARIIRNLAGSPIPGSLINMLSVAAAPEVFEAQRFANLASSWFDPQALRIHALVERWTYDEFPLPGQLFEETLEQLYREDRFLNGTLQVGGCCADLARLQAPTIAIINPAGQVVPPDSLRKGLEAAPDLSVEILTYKGNHGPIFQHLGPLVAPSAHKQLWPRILEWVSELEST